MAIGRGDHRLAQRNLDRPEGAPGLAHQDPGGRAGRPPGTPAVDVGQRPGGVDHGDAHRSGQVQQGTPLRMVFASPRFGQRRRRISIARQR